MPTISKVKIVRQHAGTDIEVTSFPVDPFPADPIQAVIVTMGDGSIRRIDSSAPAPPAPSSNIIPRITRPIGTSLAGFACWFSALDSDFKGKRWNETDAEWEIEGQTIHGHWCGYVFDMPGLYDIKLTINGVSTSIDVLVNIIKPRRIDVTPATLASKRLEIEKLSDIEVVCAPGIYDVAADDLKLTGDNIVFRGADPVCKASFRGKTGVISLTSECENVTFRDLCFGPCGDAITPRGRNIAAVNCEFKEITYNQAGLMSNSTGTVGLLVTKCYAGQDLQSYLLWNNGKWTSVHHNELHGRGYHQIRGSRYQYLGVSDNIIDALKARALAYFMEGDDYFYVHNKSTVGGIGKVGTGPLGKGDGKITDARTRHGLIAHNDFAGSGEIIEVGAGTIDLQMRDNWLNGKLAKADVEGYNAVLQRGSSDIWENGGKRV